jgi:hypothetical protein
MATSYVECMVDESAPCFVACIVLALIVPFWIALDRSDVEKMGDEPFVCPPCKQAGKKPKKKAPPPKQQRRKKDDDDDKGGRRGGRGGRGGGSDDDEDDDEGAGGDDPNDEDYVEGADVPGAVSYSITPVVAQERRPVPSMPLNPIRRKVHACFLFPRLRLLVFCSPCC